MVWGHHLFLVSPRPCLQLLCQSLLSSLFHLLSIFCLDCMGKYLEKELPFTWWAFTTAGPVTHPTPLATTETTPPGTILAFVCLFPGCYGVLMCYRLWLFLFYSKAWRSCSALSWTRVPLNTKDTTHHWAGYWGSLSPECKPVTPNHHITQQTIKGKSQVLDFLTLNVSSSKGVVCSPGQVASNGFRDCFVGTQTWSF